MVKQQKKKKHPIRRTVLLLILALIVYQVVGGYAPFARLPALSSENASAIEARADEMQRDVDSPDRATILETRSVALDERLRLIYKYIVYLYTRKS